MGGTELLQGGSFTLDWVSSSTTNPVKITLKNTSGSITDYVFTDSTPDVGNHECIIPAAQAIAGNYTVRVEKAGDASIYGDSNSYSVVGGGANIDITRPQLGAERLVGTNYGNFCE